MARSASWSLPRDSLPSRACCFWTSHWQGWGRERAREWSRFCHRLRNATPRFLPRTTLRPYSASRTGSPSWSPDASSRAALQKKYAAVPRCVRLTWVKSDGYEGCPARARSASWLWECAGALWCGVARGRGRGRRIAWAQWDGKEHIDSLHSRLHARDWRPCGSEWPRCPGLAKPSSRTCRHWLGAGGAPDLRVADGTREFDGVGPSGTSPGALEPRPDSFDVPPSARAGAQLRQSAVGRGATDAGHRPCVAHAAGTPGAG